MLLFIFKKKKKMWKNINNFYYTPNILTVPFNNKWTLKFKAQPTNAFLATFDQMFDGSFQLPTTAERAVIKSSSTIQTTKQCSAVVGSWKELNLNFSSSSFVIWFQSSPILTILVPLWFIIISLVFSYLRQLLFSGFLQFKSCNFVRSQNNNKNNNKKKKKKKKK